MEVQARDRDGDINSLWELFFHQGNTKVNKNDDDDDDDDDADDDDDDDDDDYNYCRCYLT